VTRPSARDLGASAFWSWFGARAGEFEFVREDRPTFRGRTFCVTAPLYNTDRTDRSVVMIMPHAMQPLPITRTAIRTATLRHVRFVSMGTSARGKAGPITGPVGRRSSQIGENAGCRAGRNSPWPPVHQLFHRTMLRLPRGAIFGAGLLCCSASMTPIRANIVGPFNSATRIKASMAACHSGAACSAFGSFVM